MWPQPVTIFADDGAPKIYRHYLLGSGRKHPLIGIGETPGPLV